MPTDNLSRYHMIAADGGLLSRRIPIAVPYSTSASVVSIKRPAQVPGLRNACRRLITVISVAAILTSVNDTARWLQFYASIDMYERSDDNIFRACPFPNGTAHNFGKAGTCDRDRWCSCARARRRHDLNVKVI